MNKTNMYRLSTSSVVVAMLLELCCGCPGVNASQRKSDVPCLKPVLWETHGLRFLVRREGSQEGGLLLTSLDEAQTVIDYEDGVVGNDAHGPVYELAPSTGEFQVAEDGAWESASQPVSDCRFTTGTESPFYEQGFQLVYENRTVPVAGDSAVDFLVAPESPVINLLSADGARPFPFLGVRSFDGQHYHELFSEVDGRSVGPSVKVGVGTVRDAPVDMCWTLDEEYVIYYDLAGDLDVYNLCVVPVGDTLREAGLKAEPTDGSGPDDGGE